MISSKVGLLAVLLVVLVLCLSEAESRRSRSSRRRQYFVHRRPSRPRVRRCISESHCFGGCCQRAVTIVDGSVTYAKIGRCVSRRVVSNAAKFTLNFFNVGVGSALADVSSGLDAAAVAGSAEFLFICPTLSLTRPAARRRRQVPTIESDRIAPLLLGPDVVLGVAVPPPTTPPPTQATEATTPPTEATTPPTEATLATTPPTEATEATTMMETTTIPGTDSDPVVILPDV